ncbi:MAG: response regulator [Syntrophales bacterium]|jgi:CheY-like chemotaxis protein
MGNIDILLVEDNPHDAEMILETLSQQDISTRVHAISDGAEALDYLFGPQGCLAKAEVRLPKLILLDLKLPKVSGLEILKRIKSDERTRNIPVVVFTSSDEARDRTESYRCGANSYIVKPMQAAAFSRFVADVGAYWVSMNMTTYADA